MRTLISNHHEPINVSIDPRLIFIVGKLSRPRILPHQFSIYYNALRRRSAPSALSEMLELYLECHFHAVGPSANKDS